MTGESGKNPQERSKVRIYDAGSVTAMDKLQPVISYEEHEDIITSLAYYANAEGIFYSGSRDCSIRTWDKRQNASVGIVCVNKENLLFQLSLACVSLQRIDLQRMMPW